jgi:single-strand DNA-binding protein
MFETNIVIVGNVLTAPEWRRTANSQALVTNFRVASTARRFDRETGRWVDGNHLRVRVNCWRRLAEGVAASIAVGDPVIVVGRLHTRDWTDTEGNPRTSYEMEAVAVGHDLARGKSQFFRNRPSSVTSDADAPHDTQVRGEAAELLPDHEVPAGYGDGIPDEVDEPTLRPVPAPGLDPVTGLIAGSAAPGAQEDGSPEDDLSPVSAEDEQAEAAQVEIEVEASGGETGGRRRPRRTARRQPVPA